MSASDDDFIDVAATVAGVASSSSPVNGGGIGDGNDALRALSGRLGDDGAMSASTSSQHQHQTLPPAASAPPHHSRRGWFSSLFGGGGAFPAAVQAARSKTVREKSLELEGWRDSHVEKREGETLEKLSLSVSLCLSLSLSLSLSFLSHPSRSKPSLSLSLSPRSSRHRSSTARTSRE